MAMTWQFSFLALVLATSLSAFPVSANKCCTELNLFKSPGGVLVQSFPVPGDDGVLDPGRDFFFTCTQQATCTDKQGVCTPRKGPDPKLKVNTWNCYCVIDPSKGCRTKRRARALLEDTDVINCCSAGMGDPHFTSLQGQTYDFPGYGGASFCLLTQPNLHVNARFIAGYQANSTQTWMDALSFITVDQNGASHILELHLGQAASETTWTVLFDGESIIAPEPSATWLNDVILLEREDSARVIVTVRDVVRFEVFVSYDENVLPKEIPDRPMGGRYLDFQLSSLVAAKDAHGVLGQTVRPVSDGAPIVEGNDADYATSSLTSTDCKFNRFQDGGFTPPAAIPARAHARQLLSFIDGERAYDDVPVAASSAAGSGIQWSVRDI